MILENIVGYLESKGFGTLGTNIFGAYLPNNPDECICILNSGGYSPELTFDNKGTDYPTIQVITRAIDYPTAYNKAEDIYKVLNGNTEIFSLIIAEQYPEGIGQDNKGRDEVSCNYKITINKE